MVDMLRWMITAVYRTHYFIELNVKFFLPLYIWLNGGPGCSSLAYGAFQELGPFRVNSDGKTLHKNAFAWNHAANVLFVESPAGVGFSYSNTSTDVKIGGDRKTANDNYHFLINWLQRFPEYKDRDFYISGEDCTVSHYVPQLAHNFISTTKKANKTIINLKGILMVIDPCSDYYTIAYMNRPDVQKALP
ncbi:hypothetical protein HAX54_015633 [Datura stramonium]|uniref:Uncharacterized protein n=1 Tax=Datura stramonium TaxID=4076 RepID=A0ABS8RJE7_DATST|nr:hypothetical protein [Datura stramonium]